MDLHVIMGVDIDPADARRVLSERSTVWLDSRVAAVLAHPDSLLRRALEKTGAGT